MVGVITSKISVKNSEIIDNLSIELISHSKQTIGNIKNIIVENRILKEAELFKAIDRKIRNARLSNQLLNNIPRVGVESILILSIVIISILVYGNNMSVSEYIPVIGLFIVAFQKIMPSLNSIYVNISNIFQAYDSINKLANQIERIDIDGVASNQRIDFQNLTALAVSNIQVGSNYPMYKPVNLSVHAGDKCFISGVSGVGKTSFMETLIGLLPVDAGTILVNGKSLTGAYLQLWWNTIAYIPQFPFIFSKSTTYNITLQDNHSLIDFKKLNYIVSIVELGYVVDRLKNDKLSEDGKNLSGGEKQKIILARALYSGKKILFFDESLSAIDQSTRKKVLSRIFSEFPDLTIFYISHNQDESNLFNCQLTISK
jgi:ATP-binding cassette subfamily C protein